MSYRLANGGPGDNHHRATRILNALTYCTNVFHILILPCQLSFNISRPSQDGRHFHRQHFHMHFLEWELLNFKQNVVEIFIFYWQWTIFGSDNGLSPDRRWYSLLTQNASLGLTFLVMKSGYSGRASSIPWLLHGDPKSYHTNAMMLTTQDRMEWNTARHVLK